MRRRRLLWMFLGFVLFPVFEWTALAALAARYWYATDRMLLRWLNGRKPELGDVFDAAHGSYVPRAPVTPEA